MLKNLSQCIIFNGLKNSDIETLFESIPYKIKKFQKEDMIVQADAEVKNLLIVIDGSVRGEMTDVSGKTIKIEDIESPNLLAPAFLFGMQNRFPVTLVANKAVSILFIQKADFLKLMQSNTKILSNYLDNICNRAQFLSGKIRFLSFQTIKGKLAHFFIQLANKSGNEEFIMQKSQNELAEMFGVTRPSLSRALREMDKDELIHADGKHIKILDKEGLLDLLK
jgi:CRP-like cAMP-binding protein